jgi:hypothetical protein
MCEAVVPVLRPLKVTWTVIKFVVVSQVTNAVPVPFEVGCCGFSFNGLKLGAFGPVATNSNSALPVSMRLARAAALLPAASSVAGALTPDAIGAYRTVTMHDFLGPRLVPVQPSDVTVNVPGPDNETFSAADAEPPVLVSLNVWGLVSPTPTVPKSKLPVVAGDQLIDGGPPAFPAVANTNSADATTAAATMVRTNTRITHPLCSTAAITTAEMPMIPARST